MNVHLLRAAVVMGLNLSLAVPVTVSAELTCAPASGTLPFASCFQAAVINRFAGQARRSDGRPSLPCRALRAPISSR